MTRKTLILGATSAIGKETAKLLAVEGSRLVLVGRHPERLSVIKEDLVVRGAGSIATVVADLDDHRTHEEILDRATEAMDGLDTVLLAYGVLDADEPQQVFRTNFTSAASLLERVAQRFEAKRQGTIVGISSVAGDRGRQSNYVYGASKAGLSALLQGLRNRLHPSGVRVITVKPGMIDTPMTAHMKKGVLWVGPEYVARRIHRALGGGGDVIYVPWFWRPIMTVIRALPEAVFKRLEL